MEITTLQNLSPELFEKYTDESSGPNTFSVLRTSQTGNDRVVSAERLNYLKNSDEHIMFVAVKDNVLMGMVIGQRVLGIGNDYFYIHDIVVSPDARGEGLGTKLMEAIVEGAENKWTDVVRIQLTSRPSRGTSSFFQKCGFRPRTKETGDETVVYVKDLGDYTS